MMLMYPAPEFSACCEMLIIPARYVPSGIWLPTTCTSYVAPGAGMSASARPVCDGPYGAGARAKSSCHVSAEAGRMTMVFAGTRTVCPLTMRLPPESAVVPETVATCRKPVMSNWGAAGGAGSCARTPTPAQARAATIRTATIRPRERWSLVVNGCMTFPLVYELGGPGAYIVTIGEAAHAR